MRSNTLSSGISGGIYTFIAWFPFIAVIACVVWVLAVGVMHLETNSYGTEYFVKNSETTNALQPLPTAGDMSTTLTPADIS